MVCCDFRMISWVFVMIYPFFFVWGGELDGILWDFIVIYWDLMVLLFLLGYGVSQASLEFIGLTVIYFFE